MLFLLYISLVHFKISPRATTLLYGIFYMQDMERIVSSFCIGICPYCRDQCKRPKSPSLRSGLHQLIGTAPAVGSFDRTRADSTVRIHDRLVCPHRFTTPMPTLPVTPAYNTTVDASVVRANQVLSLQCILSVHVNSSDNSYSGL